MQPGVDWAMLQDDNAEEDSNKEGRNGNDEEQGD